MSALAISHMRPCRTAAKSCQPGRLAMVAGNVRVNLDLPPFFTYAGHDSRPVGLNAVGLKRAGFTLEQLGALKKAYRILYRSRLRLEDALVRIENELDDDNARDLVRFIRGSQRGICRPAQLSKTEP